MHLSRHDLLQMDDEWLQRLPPELLLEVSKRLLHDVKMLRDRRDQTPNNSSRPSGSQAPWEKSAGKAEAAGAPREADASPSEAASTDEAPKAVSERPLGVPRKGSAKGSGKRPGKQPGSPGHGRTQKLAVTDTCEHRPGSCAVCGSPLAAEAESQAYTAWDEIDIAPPVEGRIGVMFSVTRHRQFDVRCACGHVSRARPRRAPLGEPWANVELGQWRLVGPRLAGVIVVLALRMRLSRARIRELLQEVFELSLSIGVIDETIREAGAASVPLEDVLVADLQQAAQLHVDETPWLESGQMLWLWVLASAHAVLYRIGPRSREMLDNAPQERFHGILISDGYAVCRAWENRLRCGPHLMRKLRGLAESTDARVAGAGRAMEHILKTLMAAIYEARLKPPPTALPPRHGADIARLRQLCEAHRMDDHPGLRSVVREFLYDWKVILRPLAEPHLPLSNNAAEQALRHWVIARRISHGTRSEAGSRAFALLASVIETCRHRGAGAWRYLGDVIRAARQGLTLPTLPA